MTAIHFRRLQSNKCFCFLILIAVLAFLYFVTFVKRNETKPSSSLPLQQSGAASKGKNKLILFYVPFFGKVDYYFGLGQKPFIDCGCKVNTCEATADRNRLLESDAVVFHPYDIDFKEKPFPNERTSTQRWIFHISESADYIELNWDTMKGVFNWTTCYRTDCDIYHPYIRVLKKENAEQQPEYVVTNRKRQGLVSWLVSNCKTKGKREEYVEELKKYVPVDVYGACGKPCPIGPKKVCNDLAFDNYKFYLSFENSVCKDYVTEKLLSALGREIVPIVYGAANYSIVAPPNSVINIMDFPSPKQLADYLIKLDNDDKLYNKYFEWKTKYEVKYYQAFCDLCAKLHEKHEPKVIEDLYDFYITKAKCQHEVQGFLH